MQQDLLPQGMTIQGEKDAYEIVSTVGRGGMGVVYRARRRSDQQVIALKEMRPMEAKTPADMQEWRMLFDQEAALLLGLSHPNIVRGYEIFEWQGRAYFIMEFVNGVTIEKRLRETNAPAFEQDALSWGVQMADVLHYLHTRQPPIIYRDLKPGNVILTPEGPIKFIDFGVARTYKARKAKDTVAIGTYGYAPPEQYGKGQTDARSDIYTLGATLYHILTNLGPIPLRTPEIGSIQEHNPSVKRETELVIIKAMQQDRERRYASAAEMKVALAACLTTPLPAAVAAPPPAADLDVTQRGTPPVPPMARRPVVTPRTAAPVTIPAREPAAPATRPAPARQAPTPRPSATSPAIGGTPAFCPNCGRANKPSARFCAACGSSIPAMPAPQPSRAAAPQPVVRPARFVISSPRGTRQFPLAVLPCRIGRRDPSQNHYPELDLADYDRGHASRRHAVIERRGSQYVITDVGSVNGTLLNGVRVPAHRPQPLKPGDVVKVGDVELRFEIT